MTATVLPPERESAVAVHPRADQLSLADALDRILYRGVALQGNLTIGLADVDLLFLDLRLLLGSVDTIWPEGRPPVLPVQPRTAYLPPPSRLDLGSPEEPSLAPAAITTSEVKASTAPLPPVTPPTAAPSEIVTSKATPGPVVRAAPVEESRDSSANGSSTAQGLIRLVLTLVKLLHDVLEKQAIHRMEAGRLTDQQIDRLGEALSAQADEILKLQRQFGFSEKDLSLALDVPEGTY
jgi:hypothetical protein